jgi:Fic family protein
METGLQLLEQLPISNRVLRTIHETLLQDVRGRERRPGEFRETPVWIGSPTNTPEHATYVPPLSDEMHAALRDWELFANEDPRMPMLVRCALPHYQFETIHPFLDGNGRLGRLLIVFFLMQQGRLPAPLLYISSYLEDHRPEYYERLQAGTGARGAAGVDPVLPDGSRCTGRGRRRPRRTTRRPPGTLPA